MLKRREQEIFRLLEGGIHRSHNGGGFLALADKIAKSDSGAIAAVLPLVGATNYATREMRIYLAQQFHIETIVTSHDPTRIYFSENTNIGEMLLVCRRWQGEGEKPPTQIVNLYENPATPAEAIGVARDIIDGRRIKGTIQLWSRERIEAGNWGGVQFLSPYLCEKYFELANREMLKTRGLGSFADIGPAGQGVRGIFDRSEVADKYAMRALWYHKTDVTQKMLAQSDTYIQPKPGKAKPAHDLWAKRGTLMLVTRARLNTVRCISVRLNEKVLGSLWVPCKFESDIRDSRMNRSHEDWMEKVACAYLNSTVGLLAILGDRTNKIPSYPHFSMDDLRQIPVPDFNGLEEARVARLAEAYDAHSQSILLPLPQIMADETRQALDEAIIAALDIDREVVAKVRTELSREPSITGKPYEP